MASSTILQVGDNVPVCLQLVDGNVLQHPQAEIRDNNDFLLTTLDLSHIASGLYVSDIDYFMPDEDYVTITYIVYSDVPHLIESLTYLRDLDIFVQAYAVGEYDARLQVIQTNLDFLKHIEGGRWKIDTATNVMIFYEVGGAEIARFDLKDKDGNPAHENVYERVRVP